MITRFFNLLAMLENGAISFKRCQNFAVRGVVGALHREMRGVHCIGETIERGVDLCLAGATVLAMGPTSTL
jgi:hypothetical protein